jgi:hypothetical protein
MNLTACNEEINVLWRRERAGGVEFVRSGELWSILLLRRR